MSKQSKKSVLKGSCLWGILIFALLIFIDQITKIAAELYLNGKDIPLFGGLVSLTLTHNPGIAYGIGSDASPTVKLAVIIVTGVLMAGLSVAYFLTDKRRSFLRTAFVFIVAGGVGNLIDRLYYKVWLVDETAIAVGVRDMVNLSKFGFAVCNFADFFISAGAVMLVLSLLFFDSEAFYPVGKYKALQKEKEGEEERKQKEETK